MASLEITREQAIQVISNQRLILEKIEKLTAFLDHNTIMYWDKEILNMYQAAKLLNVYSSTLQEACFNREIPCRKIGSTYIFVKEALIEWLRSNEIKYEVKDSIDIETAAELLGVTKTKLREWSKAYQYYKIPAIREGVKFYYDKEQLLAWAEKAEPQRLIAEHIKNCEMVKRRWKEAEERREAERLEKEALKKRRLEAKVAKLIDNNSAS